MLYALLGAVAIGLVLGLLGSGGSILTVPVLVYLAGQPGKVAIAESLAIVGTIAAFAVLPYARRKLVDWRSVFTFGMPGIAGAYLGAVLAAYVPVAVQLVLFGVVMLAAAAAMLRGRPAPEGAARPARPLWSIALLGAAVGVMTGLVGVGGGFMIVPALVLLVGLDMRLAVGTSLSIIVLNSAAGFFKHLGVLAAAGAAVDWLLVGTFAAIGVAGSFAGSYLGGRVPQARLRRGFAMFLLVMGAFILVKEGPGALAGTKGEPMPATATEGAAPAGRIRHLSPAETAALLASTPEAIVVDVRTPAEVVASGRLAGALVLDVSAPGFEARAQDALDPSRPTILYCRSGNRSEQAARRLAALGFADLSNAGGFDALARAGLATEPYTP